MQPTGLALMSAASFRVERDTGAVASCGHGGDPAAAAAYHAKWKAACRSVEPRAEQWVTEYGAALQGIIGCRKRPNGSTLDRPRRQERETSP
jgi:hypothetical protein